METQEKIEVIVDAIKALDKATILNVSGAGTEITQEQVPDYETWDYKDVKRDLFSELGKLYYKQLSENPAPVVDNPPVNDAPQSTDTDATATTSEGE